MKDSSLRARIQIEPARQQWLNGMATQYHYMHRPIHRRAFPFGWAVRFDGDLYQPDGAPSGLIMFASIHYTKLRGEFGYAGLPTKWQVLSLSRLWLHDNLPHNSETVVIAKAIKQVQARWLEVHPPVDYGQPYQIRKIISYADTRYHAGTIYRAANFREYGRTMTQDRHQGTRGDSQAGGELICYIYDLDDPKRYTTPQQSLFDAR